MPSLVPSRGLTPKFVESLTPKEKPYELADPGSSGLRLRVTPKGAKVFRWYVSSLGKVVTIGPWAMHETPAHVTLAQARGWLEKLKAARAAGVDQLNAVEAELKAQLAPKAAAPVIEAQGPTVAEMGVKFLKVLDGQRKRPAEARYIMEKDILPVIGAIRLGALKKKDARAVVERVVERGATVHAGKVLGLTKQLLSYCANVEEDFVNPIADLRGAWLGVENNIRERWLNEEEIALFWGALNPDPVSDTPASRSVPDPKTCAALRLLLVLALRSAELRLARWEDVDLEADVPTLTVPVANQKLTLAQARQAKPFVVPLPPLAVALFKTLKAMAGKSPWVLSSGESAAGPYSEKALNRAMGRCWKTTPALAKLPLATCHDLRRTARSWLARLGVDPWVAEAVLNHSPGRMVRTYNKDSAFEPRRKALDLWAAYLERVVNPEATTNVAYLSTQRAR